MYSNALTDCKMCQIERASPQKYPLLSPPEFYCYAIAMLMLLCWLRRFKLRRGKGYVLSKLSCDYELKAVDPFAARARNARDAVSPRHHQSMSDNISS